MGIWQKWLGSWTRWWNTKIKVNPTQLHEQLVHPVLSRSEIVIAIFSSTVLPYSIVQGDGPGLGGAVVRQLVRRTIAARARYRHNVSPPPLDHLPHERLDRPEVGDDVDLETHLDFIWKKA